MARPTVASLSADLKAALNALNTYAALHNELALQVKELSARVKELRESPMPTRPVRPPARRILDSDERTRAIAAYFADHPYARSATNEQLAPYASH